MLEKSMTTKELIAKLEALPDLEVEILIDGKYYSVADVLDAKGQHRAITLLIAQTTADDRRDAQHTLR
jgi:hypothetical protein